MADVRDIQKGLKKTNLNGDDSEEEVEDRKLVSRAVGLIEASGEVEVLEKGKDDEDDPLKGAIDSFDRLNLSEDILKGVYAYKFKVPSKIQSLAIPAILKRPAVNFIGQAQSGTGKTGAFSLSIIASVDESKKFPQAICLSPTRELCRQTYDVIVSLARFTKLKILLVVPEAEIPATSIQSQILVCTPGKLDSLIKNRKFNLANISMFVIDEADEILGIQGQENIAVRLNSKLSNSCQRCLFSATYNERVKTFAHLLVPQPRVSILIPPEKLTLAKLLQFYIHCGSKENKFKVLESIYRTLSVGQCIIFVQTRATAAELAKRMQDNSHEVSVLYGGDMKEAERDRVMDAFRTGTARTLITTNVLARGVDVLQVSLVVNYDLPVTHEEHAPDCETYLHRIGRSARFGNSGIAINLVHDQKTLEILQKISKHFDKPINELKESELGKISKLLEEMC
jgi:ATP-dependent RNA helicase DDX19/DBP5